MAQRNTPERADLLARRADEQRARVPRITPVPSRASYSTRGQTGKTWQTKRHTAMRHPPQPGDDKRAKLQAQHQARGYNLICDLYARVG